MRVRAVLHAVIISSTCIVAAAAASALAKPATVQSSPSPPDPLAVLSAYAGTWNGQTTHFDTPFSQAGHDASVLRNDCWRSGDYYACHQIVDGKSAALLVFMWDAANRSYASYPIVAGSGDIHPGTLLIDGNTWTFPWQSTRDGKTTWFRVVNVFVDADDIDSRQEYSTDGTHWSVMSSAHEHRSAR